MIKKVISLSLLAFLLFSFNSNEKKEEARSPFVWY